MQGRVLRGDKIHAGYQVEQARMGPKTETTLCMTWHVERQGLEKTTSSVAHICNSVLQVGQQEPLAHKTLAQLT